ncbi:MAG: FAD-dependent oxidoreductase [Kiritimatiellaeota bacterium]|nr:FAD-dependent oxidoreductase [Kiritimatiellota bacterium]
MGRLDIIRGAPPAPAATMDARRAGCELRADVCVAGGGSGGLGAALAAARKGASVIVVERERLLGGTSTAGGVSNWEPGPGDAFAREIFERLSKTPKAVIMDKPTYDETLTRAGNGHIQFEPDKFHRVVTDMLRETGCCRVLLNTTFTEVTVNTRDRRVVELRATRPDSTVYSIRAGVFIDCTGSGFLCQAAGCDVMLGAESRDRFGEPAAPPAPVERLNAIELIYRIRPSKDPIRQDLPSGMEPRRGGGAWPQPSGGRFVNTCGGLAPGWLLMEKGWIGARKELERRVLSHWHWLQKEYYPRYEFDRFSPMLAVREAQRIVCEYVLTQIDLIEGIEKQTHDDIIAIADHPMDTHGAGGSLGKVSAPYGIPFRCLVPKGGWRNLLIACRGAGFSHIAASSCRLSRTMIALGHAAGSAAAQCAAVRCDVPDVDIGPIQRELGMPPEKRPAP